MTAVFELYTAVNVTDSGTPTLTLYLLPHLIRTPAVSSRVQRACQLFIYVSNTTKFISNSLKIICMTVQKSRSTFHTLRANRNRRENDAY